MLGLLSRTGLIQNLSDLDRTGKRNAGILRSYHSNCQQQHVAKVLYIASGWRWPIALLFHGRAP